MHEFSLARDVLDIVIESAQEHGLTGVSEVRLEVGRASGVSVDALLYARTYKGEEAEYRKQHRGQGYVGLVVSPIEPLAQCLKTQGLHP